jgi:hypothetical protein
MVEMRMRLLRKSNLVIASRIVTSCLLEGSEDYSANRDKIVQIAPD